MSVRILLFLLPALANANPDLKLSDVGIIVDHRHDTSKFAQQPDHALDFQIRVGRYVLPLSRSTSTRLICGFGYELELRLGTSRDSEPAYLYVNIRNGEQRHALAKIGEGEFIGDRRLFFPLEWLVQTWALEDGVVTLRLPEELAPITRKQANDAANRKLLEAVRARMLKGYFSTEAEAAAAWKETPQLEQVVNRFVKDYGLGDETAARVRDGVRQIAPFVAKHYSYPDQSAIAVGVVLEELLDEYDKGPGPGTRDSLQRGLLYALTVAGRSGKMRNSERVNQGMLAGFLTLLAFVPGMEDVAAAVMAYGMGGNLITGGVETMTGWRLPILKLVPLEKFSRWERAALDYRDFNLKQRVARLRKIAPSLRFPQYERKKSHLNQLGIYQHADGNLVVDREEGVGSIHISVRLRSGNVLETISRFAKQRDHRAVVQRLEGQNGRWMQFEMGDHGLILRSGSALLEIASMAHDLFPTSYSPLKWNKDYFTLVEARLHQDVLYVVLEPGESIDRILERSYTCESGLSGGLPATM